MNIFEEQETYLWVTYSGFPHKPRNIHPLSLTDSQYLYSNMQQPQQHPELAPGTQTNARLCLLGDLGNSLLILQSTLMAGHLQVKEQFSPILVVHGACTRSDASGTELCQGQTCSPSPLASSPPSFHKSSPSLTLCQPPAKALQPKPILPSCSQRRMGYAAYAHMLSLLSFCPSSRHSGLLSASHPFMLHFPPSATRSLCPPVDPDCLSSTMQAASPPPSDRRTPTC